MRRRPGWLPTAAATVLLMLTLAAGFWQLERAEHKRALKALYARQAQEPPTLLTGRLVDAEQFRFRRVVVTGRFDPAHEIFVDNRVIAGKPGYRVVTPLKIDNSERHVLVERGWVERGWDRSVLPDAPMPLGRVTIEGIAMIPGRYLELSADTVEGKVWQNLDVARIAATVPYPLQPVVVVQINDTGDGLRREWQPPDTGVEKHLGYAFQWFSMAAAVVVIYGVMYARRRAQSGPQ